MCVYVSLISRVHVFRWNGNLLFHHHLVTPATAWYFPPDPSGKKHQHITSLITSGSGTLLPLHGQHHTTSPTLSAYERRSIDGTASDPSQGDYPHAMHRAYPRLDCAPIADECHLLGPSCHLPIKRRAVHWSARSYELTRLTFRKTCMDRMDLLAHMYK